MDKYWGLPYIILVYISVTYSFKLKANTLTQNKKLDSIRIAVLDKQVIVHDLLTLCSLNADIDLELNLHFKDERNLLQNLNKHKIEILVFDVDRPLNSGISLLKKIKRNRSDIKVLIYSKFTDYKTIGHLYSLGASCYLAKSANAKQLIYAILRVKQNGFYCCQDASQFFSNAPNSRSNVPEFTERELEIAKLARMEFSNSEIAEQLNLHIKTIETHKSSLILKTDSKRFVGALDYLLSNGILPLR